MTRIRSRAARLLGTAVVSLAATASIAGAAQAGTTPPSGELTGCPTGAVCVYPDTDWNWGTPSHVFYGKGTHQVTHEYGEHRVYNNQGDLDYADLCAGDGEYCDHLIAPGEYTDVNLTGVHSIRLFTY